MHADFLQAILEDPFDDTPRFVYADWLEECGGDPLRAEFIRVQCNASAVPVVVDGRDLRRWASPPLLDWAQNWARGFVCKITCSTPDFLHHAETLFRAQPITEVELTDRAPDYDPPSETYVWRRESRSGGMVLLASILPQVLHERLPTHAFFTPNLARFALSNACVSYGRELAGLPPLKESKS